MQALAASTPKCRPRDDPRPPIPAGIQDEIRLKNRLRRRWQVTRDPALKVEVNRLQRSVTRRLNEWRNGLWIAKLGDESSYSVPPRSPRGDSLSHIRRKPKRLPTIWRLSFSVIEMVDLGLRSYFLASASEPKLTNPKEVQEAIMGLKVRKTPGSNGIPNRTLKHLPQRAVSLLVLDF